jgi:hypothetical protein
MFSNNFSIFPYIKNTNTEEMIQLKDLLRTDTATHAELVTVSKKKKEEIL